MLRPVAKLSRIIGQLPRGRVIFVSPNRVRRKANFGEKLTHEAGLVSAVSSGYDLGFAAALRNNRLALAFPRGRPAIEVKDYASRGFPSIFAVSPGGIGKEKEAVGQCRVIVARVPNAVQWVTLKVAQDSNRKRPVSAAASRIFRRRTLLSYRNRYCISTGTHLRVTRIRAYRASAHTQGPINWEPQGVAPHDRAGPPGAIYSSNRGLLEQ